MQVLPPYVTVTVCVPSASSVVGAQVKPESIVSAEPSLNVAVRVSPAVSSVSPTKYSVLVGSVFTSIFVSVIFSGFSD